MALTKFEAGDILEVGGRYRYAVGYCHMSNRWHLLGDGVCITTNTKTQLRKAVLASFRVVGRWLETERKEN